MRLLHVKFAFAILIFSILGPPLFSLLFRFSSLISFVLVASAVGTVVLFFSISWTVLLGLYLDRYNCRSRGNLVHAARPSIHTTPAAWEAINARSQWPDSSPYNLKPLFTNQPLVSSAINDVMNLVLRDFVLVWYSSISSSNSFPAAVLVLIHGALEELLSRFANLDLTSLVVRRVLPHITTHVERFRQSEISLRGAGLERQLTQSDELDLLLANRYAGRDAKLHPAIDNLSTVYTRQSEEAHLRQLVEKVLPTLLPESISKGVLIVVREIIVCQVLCPIMELLAEPDFWNRAIDDLAGAAIRQQKLISKVRNIIEAQSSTSRPLQSSDTTDRPTEVITLRTDHRHFQLFLRSISRCDSLLDARRLKNDVIGEIRRTRSLLAEHEKEDWIAGYRTEEIVAFLDRLYTAKRKVEQRIKVLGGNDNSRSSMNAEAEYLTRFTIRDILTNPNSLSYFMEFMDRRGRSLLVQFWLTVESFKSPLESVNAELGEEYVEKPLDASAAATLHEDISMVYALYFSGLKISSVLSTISKRYVDVIRNYIQDPTSSNVDVNKTRKAVMLAQQEVEQDMNHDFADFRKSDLWYRTIDDLDRSEHVKIQPPPLIQQRTSSSSSIGLLSSWTQGLVPEKLLLRPGSEPYDDRIDHIVSEHPAQLKASEPSSIPSSTPSSSRSESRSQGISSKLNLDILISERPPESTRTPLFSTSEQSQENERALEEIDRIDAIQAALTDIIAKERHLTGTPPEDISTEEHRKVDTPENNRKDNAPKRKVIFDDADDGDHNNEEDDQQDDETILGTFQLAAPGDLQLSFEISRLGEKITRLDAQNTMLDTLIRKAELTGNAQELKLLHKSKSALGRELRQLNFQKTQYEQQDSANRLIAGRTRVAIVNSTAGDEDGKAVVRYLIEVQQLALDGNFASGWVVARRYNEFFSMHQKLKERYVSVKNLDFPGKRLVTALSSALVDARRVALEKYLQQLLDLPLVCDSNELRVFLSRESPFKTTDVAAPAPKTNASFPGQRLVSSMYRTFTESIDEMLFGPSMLDVMIGRLSRHVAEFSGIIGSGIADEDFVSHALKVTGKAVAEETLLHLPGNLKPMEGETSTSSFSAPICDLILAVFELDKKNNWLRRQAIVIILQQVLGDTIERKLRDTIKSYSDESHILNVINMFKESLWPGGQLRTTGVQRSAEERYRSKESANRKLTALIPDVAANMIGRSNARRGARRIFAVLQNRRLNQQIMYTILDEVFTALFPETVANKT